MRLAALLGLAATAVFAVTRQARLMSDGIWILEFLHRPHHDGIPFHPLFWFLQWTCAAIAPGASAEALARGTSAVAGGVAAALVFLAARGLGARRRGAMAGALLLVTSPAGWFFATTIEYHALTMATAAAALCVTVFAPWRRHRALALALSAAALAPAFLSHQVVALLGPGLVLLVGWLAARAGRPFTWWGLVFVVGPALLAGLLLPQFLIELWNGAGGIEFEGERRVLSAYAKLFAPWHMIWSGWATRLALLLPAAFLGARALWKQRGLLAALAVSVGFPWLVFVTVYPLPERGGFFLASATLWAVLASFARLRAATWSMLVVAQAALGLIDVRTFDSAFDPAERARQAQRALPDGGVLVSAEDLAPRIELALPNVAELHLLPLVQKSRRRGIPPPDFIRELVAQWARRGAHTNLALDLSYRFWVDRSDVAPAQSAENIRRRHEPYLDALEESIEEHFTTTLLDHDSWPILVLEPRTR